MDVCDSIVSEKILASELVYPRAEGVKHANLTANLMGQLKGERK